MKVIIIGASISGLYTATLLAKQGVDVEVYDRMSVLGSPSRTLIVTGKINEVLDSVPEEMVLNQVKYLELFSRSRSARLDLSYPDLIVERRRFVELFSRMAEEAGARMILGHRFEGFAQFGKKVAVTLRNLETNEARQVSTDILVGADGVHSAVSQAASRNGHPVSALVQAKVALPEDGEGDTYRVWFDTDRTNYFYWLIPESDRVGAVGLIADDVSEAKTRLIEFLREKRLEAIEFQSSIVPMHRFGNADGTLDSNRNVFAVGDAAAQVKVTTVGGVVPGLYGAKALAQAILNGRNYRKELGGLKIELHLHLLVRHVLNRFSDQDYDELIGMVDGGLKEILQEWTRDELTQSLLRMIWAEPRLITLGAKVFLRSLL
ncbi:MAG TPA: NAD(P)/FAD-dependent oxidoreductase [Thermodesulfobacteriota bacterium]|nr:NAD(P)/FAD-dependent oxidoreductase [Thermodesulfobacteriota bacterium]